MAYYTFLVTETNTVAYSVHADNEEEARNLVKAGEADDITTTNSEWDGEEPELIEIDGQPINEGNDEEE